MARSGFQFGNLCNLTARVGIAVLALATPMSGPAATRIPWTSNRMVGSPNPPAPYTVERVFTAVRFDQPTDMTFLPGSSILFASEQSGRIYSFDTQTPATPPRLVFDLRRQLRGVNELLGFALHPGFATNRYLFVNYNGPEDRKDGARVSRFTVSDGNPPNIDPASEVVIIRWPAGGHNGCTLAFGPDGMLYISNGDGAAPDPPDGKFLTGQDISDLMAGVLRIDVDHPEANRAYGVPRDNPFVDLPGVRPEVWAFGMRNPFRMSFGPDGTLWLGDVGWEQWEMVYRVKRGGNYGWPITEGPNQHVRTDVKPGPGPILPPLYAVPHTDGASITGGRVYTGRRLPELRGAYLYGDWETGRFWEIRSDGDNLITNRELCDTSLKPVAFAASSDGDLLILDYNGGLYRFAPNQAPAANTAFPRKLSETGLFASLQPLRSAEGVVGYRPNVPMWSDHASADWVLGVPGDAAISTEGGVGNIAGSTWYFPTNTVLARTLSLELTAGQPASARRIETQTLQWDGQTWSAYTFRWNESQTDAELVPAAGTNETFHTTDSAAPGGKREIRWRFLSRTECIRCHNAWAGDALTLSWQQLGPAPAGAGEGPSKAPSELSRLASLGVLQVRNPPRPAPRVLANPYATDLPVADRARSWLHANCSACHRFGAGGSAKIRLNIDQTLAEMRAVEERPNRGDFGLLAPRLIAAGDPYRSVILYRLSTEGAGHMPYLGARLVDETGAAAVRDWIRMLPPKEPDARDTDAMAARRRQAEISSLLRQGGASAAVALLSDMNGALAALEETTDSAQRKLLAGAAMTHTNALVRDLFQRWLPTDQRRPTLGSDINPQSILSLTGSAERGRALFLGVAQCSRCHLIDGQGRAFGPDLSGLKKKYSRAQILEQILEPSRLVAPEFKTTIVTTRDNTEYSGFVVRKTDTQIVLREQEVTSREIPIAEVQETRESTLSAMPEGLLGPLTALEAADIVEFLFQR